MATIHCFEDVQAWQHARSLTRDLYHISGRGAFGRDIVLRSQVRRAAVSIGSNIAEGFERGRDGEMRHFLIIAKGSAGEVRSQLHTALDLDYVDASTYEDLIARCLTTSRLIGGMIKYLSRATHQ